MKRNRRRAHFNSLDRLRRNVLEPLEQRCMLDSTTVINEIMYHPPVSTGAEWLELHNQMAVDMDLSKWSLDDAIKFEFPENTIIPGGGYLIVTSDPETFRAETGIENAFGPWQGRLSNSGENVELRDRNHRLMSSVNYSDTGDWPLAPDGSGTSLSKLDANYVDSALATSWRSSLSAGGTPGARNATTDRDSFLRINEVTAAHADAIQLELVNTGETAFDLRSASLRLSSRPNDRIALPALTIQPGEITAVPHAIAAGVAQEGDRIFLESIDGASVFDAVRLQETAQGRSPDGTGEWFQTAATTIGDVNRFQFERDVVINEIMYHHRPELARPHLPAVVETMELISLDGDWRYNASGDELGNDWYTNTHPVAGNWVEGYGLIGFDSDGAPAPGINTELDDPSQNTIVTYYFETDFEVPAEVIEQAPTLRLRHIVDDGAVFYMNGEEFHRVAIADETVTSTTVAIPGVNNARLSQVVEFPASILSDGVNRLSVSVHQSTPLSNDVLFGMELITDVETEPAIPGTEFKEATEEWIELYNRGDATVDLSGWRLDDAIRFVFPEETMLEPGGLVVISNDAVALRAKHPQLSNVIGDFRGRLSNSGERIRLLDELGNPADEVSYFDGGRWDTRADGWGSSLELIDADADNSRAEAWAASDEASRSTWQTYSYRASGERTVRGEPSVWNEFAFGLLDGAGEVFVDDISVIEDPDGEAKQLIQNGTFDDGTLDHWRTLGNHQRTSIARDEDNFVMRVLADGATEYQGNQLETTLVDNQRIDQDATYEISFRAKWINGARQLNTRLYFNRAPKTTQLTVPAVAGTPGRMNGRLQENIGPTYDNLRHSPLVPKAGEAISVTVEATDPQSIESMTLWFNVDETNWQSAPMSLVNDATYAAQIPAQADGAVIQFYVEGSDTQSATSAFPAAGRASRALVVVDDDSVDGPLHAFRLLMTDSDSDHLHTPTNSLSNQRLGSTVIYQGESFYDTKVRLKGSFVGRNVARVGFNIAFNPDQKFRGVHTKVSIDRSTHANLGVDEILLKHAAAHAGGIPTMYDDLIDFVAPRRNHTGKAALRMSGFDNIYLDSQFENGSDGTVYEYEVIRWPTTTVDGDPESLKRAGGGGDPNGYANIDFRDQGDDKENYRWTNLIVSNRSRDDYSRIIALHKAMSVSSSEVAAATAEVIDTDQWMRTLAFQMLVGPGDAAFTGSNIHNFRLYARPDGQVMYMPWDWDSAFQISTSAPIMGSGRMARVVRDPVNRRAYYGHMLDIIDTTLNRDYMERWTDHYGELGRQNFGGRLRFFESRSDYATNRIVDRDAPPVEFTISTPSPVNIVDTAVTIQGTGWVNVREIRMQGSSEPLDVTWSASEDADFADTWQVRVPVAPGPNFLTFEAYDFQGEILASATVEARSFVIDRPLQEYLHISELHYNPTADDDEEFIELTNISDTETLDLSGVTITNGPSEPFVVANGTTLEPGEHKLIVSDANVFHTLYPDVDNALVLGEFSGRLADDGEQITIIDADGATLVDFAYRDDQPWPTAADGAGSSLQRLNYTVTSADAWFAGLPNPGSSNIAGDVNQDGKIDVADINLIALAVREGDQRSEFDLNQDDQVTELDHRFLIENVLGTTLGDANLDGVFNSRDFVLVFGAGEYEDDVALNSTWSTGDWDGDGEFSTRDLVAAFQLGGYDPNL